MPIEFNADYSLNKYNITTSNKFQKFPVYFSYYLHGTKHDLPNDKVNFIDSSFLNRLNSRFSDNFILDNFNKVHKCIGMCVKLCMKIV